MKPKVVFDTNVYISAILFGGAPRICLELARQGKIELYTSRAILLELTGKLRTKFDWHENSICEVLVGISQFAFIVTPRIHVDVINQDPTDNIILEAAQEGKVDYIVSGDKKHILPLKTFKHSKILAPADFLKEITSLHQ